MEAGRPSTESPILHLHVISIAENRQKAFVFVICNQRRRLTPIKGDKEEGLSFLSEGSLQVCPNFVNLRYSERRIEHGQSGSPAC